MTHTAPAELYVAAVPHDGIVETRLTLSQSPGESGAEMLGRLNEWLAAHPQVAVARLAVFGLQASEHGPAAQGWDWPVTWVEESGDGPSNMVGAQVYGIEGAPVTRLRHNGRVIGSVYEDSAARYCMLGGVLPGDSKAAKGAQTRECFEIMDQVLKQTGMTFLDVARTWFYLDDILGWYGEFNQARTAFFGERGVFNRVVPASTGVSGVNNARAALVADALAVVPKSAVASMKPMPSPLQCPALEYGSSFSRAVEMATPDHRYLWISGTASIAEDGRTDHVGLMESQVDLTLKVVHAILTSRGMDWDDVTRGVAYFRQASDRDSFTTLCAKHGLPLGPVLCSENYICRDDLLFEIELDALRLE